MATDSITLVDAYGWTIAYGWTLQTLIRRYVVPGVCCLIALALIYAWDV